MLIKGGMVVAWTRMLAVGVVRTHWILDGF